jgi:hypothetical protein
MGKVLDSNAGHSRLSEFRSLSAEVVTAASAKKSVFRDVTPYSVVYIWRRFGGACCFHIYHGADKSLARPPRILLVKFTS